MAKYKSLIIFLLFLLAGCSGLSEYDAFYKQQAPTTFEPTQNVAFIPVASSVDDFYSAYLKEFLPIGRLSFNGPPESPETFIGYGKKVGADIVILSAAFDREQRVDGSLPLPTTSQSYVSVFTPSGGMYSGTITTQGTEYVPYSYTIQRYYYNAIFLKRVGAGKAPWEYSKADFVLNENEGDRFTGPWKNDKYRVRVYRAKDEYLAFLASTGEDHTYDYLGPLKSFRDTINKAFPVADDNSLQWNAGDLKFRFDAITGRGIYFMGSKVPMPANFAISRFGYLEIEINNTAKDKVSFMHE